MPPIYRKHQITALFILSIGFDLVIGLNVILIFLQNYLKIT